MYLYETKKWNIKLTMSQHQVLSIFCEKEIAHAYDCRKYLISKFNKEIAPKNVRKHVLNLCSLGLLKRKVIEEPTKHSAIYYTLSSLGIFYVINQSNRISDDLHYTVSIEPIIKNHLNNPLFKYFLYPIIDQKLIHKIDDYNIFAFVKIYLNDCTQSLNTLFEDLLEIKKNGGQSYPISTIEHLLDSSLTKNDYGSLSEFIKYIQQRFNINGLDPNLSKIEEIKKNNTFKITSKNKILLLEKNENKDKIFLYEQQNNNKTLIFEFNYETIDSQSDTYFINEIRPQSIEDSIIFYQERIEREYKNVHLPKLLHKLIENCHHHYYHPYYGTRNIIENYLLLANNSNFVSYLDKIKQDFDSQYNLFKSMQNLML
jgi:hypothetical protein